MRDQQAISRRWIADAYDGPPVPEAVGGAIVGGMIGLAVAAFFRLAEPGDPLMWSLILAGALASAVVSWIIAARSRKVAVVQTERPRLQRAA